MVQVRQAPHEVLLPASDEIQSVALDKGKPAGNPLGPVKGEKGRDKIAGKKIKKIGPAENRSERWLLDGRTAEHSDEE